MHVCFVALNAYPAIEPRVSGGFGGIETRSWLFAKALAKRPDIQVSFVVRHHQPLLQDVYEGVQLVQMTDKLYPIRDSLLSRIKSLNHFPWKWLVQPKLSDLYYLPRLAISKYLRGTHQVRKPDSFYAKIEADLYLTFGVQSTSATVIATTQQMQKPAVLFLGSDNDLDERYIQPSDFVSIYRDRADVCAWVLTEANQIFCQTELQQQLLKSRFHRHGEIISNPIDVDWWDHAMQTPLQNNIAKELGCYALWVGRADAIHKRPQVLIELADLCPQTNFLMIMNPRDDVVDSQIRTSCPENVKIIREVPFAEMPQLFANANCLVNTSALEGFPNTFLQAALSGVPIASLNVEPGFIERASAGYYADGNLKSLAQYVQQCSSGNNVQSKLLIAREYVTEHHSVDAQALRLEEELAKLLE